VVLMADLWPVQEVSVQKSSSKPYFSSSAHSALQDLHLACSMYGVLPAVGCALLADTETHFGTSCARIDMRFDVYIPLRGWRRSILEHRDDNAF
jgi:hypothetical protein